MCCNVSVIHVCLCVRVQHVGDVAAVRVHQHGDRGADQHQQRHARARRLRAAVRAETEDTHRGH